MRHAGLRAAVIELAVKDAEGALQPRALLVVGSDDLTL